MKNLLIFFILGTLSSCGEVDLSKAIDESSLSEKQRSFLTEFNGNLDYQHTASSIVVKTDTEMGGEWIIIEHFLQGDTVWNKYQPMYVAYNLENYVAGNFDNWENNLNYSYSSLGDIIDLADIGNNRYEGKYGAYCGLGELSCTTVTFEDSTNFNKDLEKIGSKIEDLEVEKAREMLVNYGLSTVRAEKLGKLMVSYNKIKTKRALSGREKDFFTKELTGMSFDKASEMLVDEGYDALIDKASEVNGADPEAIKELLNEVM